MKSVGVPPSFVAANGPAQADLVRVLLRLEEQVTEVQAQLVRIDARLVRLEEQTRRRRGADSSALSMRDAARRLGLGRKALGELVADGRIRKTSVNGKQRIPLAEVERVANEGTAKYVGPSRKARSARGAPNIRDVLERAAQVKVA